MKRIFFFVGLFATYILNAQNGADALRYSLLQSGNGTGRTMGVAGAMGALGADFSALSNNPAGVAAYRSSEFVITPGYQSADIRSKLNGDGNTAQSERSSKFYLSNIGLVAAHLKSGSKWTTSNFAIGFNRQENFDNSFYYEGKSEGSIVNRFLEKANNAANSGKGLDEFEEGLAYESGAIYPNQQVAGSYSSDFDGQAKNANILHRQEGAVSGRVRELLMSYGANYKEKVLIGASVGVPFISYYENKSYEEEDDESLDGTNIGEVPYFKYLNFKENLSQTGYGINAKLGVIFKPTQNVRLGVAAHTPTIYKVNETYSTEFTYTYIDATGSQTTKSNSPDGSFTYKIRTPMKLTGSAAYLVGKKGFISADLDYIDYSKMSFQFDSDKSAENQKNNDILNTYKATVNMRVGAEYAMDIFRLRAGFATLGFPTNTSDDKGYFDTATKLYSAGIGLRERKFYADLGYQIYQSNTIEKPYLVSADYSQPTVNRSRSNSKIVVTLGFKF